MTSELQSVTRIIFGFLVFRHGMEQVFGFPAAYREVETDSPFLTPMPHRGRPNASRLVPHTVRALSEVTGVELGELCDTLTRTAERVFGKWDL